MQNAHSSIIIMILVQKEHAVSQTPCNVPATLTSREPTRHICRLCSPPQRTWTGPYSFPLFGKRLRIFFTRSSTLNGFEMTASMPAASMSFVCASRTLAETPRIGDRPALPVSCSSRISTVAALPSLMGISWRRVSKGEVMILDICPRRSLPDP